MRGIKFISIVLVLVCLMGILWAVGYLIAEAGETFTDADTVGFEATNTYLNFHYEWEDENKVLMTAGVEPNFCNSCLKQCEDYTCRNHCYNLFCK